MVGTLLAPLFGVNTTNANDTLVDLNKKDNTIFVSFVPAETTQFSIESSEIIQRYSISLLPPTGKTNKGNRMKYGRPSFFAAIDYMI